MPHFFTLIRRIVRHFSDLPNLPIEVLIFVRTQNIRQWQDCRVLLTSFVILFKLSKVNCTILALVEWLVVARVMEDILVALGLAGVW